MATFVNGPIATNSRSPITDIGPITVNAWKVHSYFLVKNQTAIIDLNL